MQNDLVKQWTDSNKLALESFKNIANSNVNTIDQMLNSFVNPSAYAEMTKNSISLMKDFAEVYSDTSNDLLQNQLKLMNLNTTSEAFKDLGDIYVSSMTSLGQKQAELMRLYVETVAKYLETLKGAKKIDDLINVQASMFSELQEKVKTNMVDTMGVFNSINSAMDNWTQKSLDVIATADS
jgi:hypothetical protein